MPVPVQIRARYSETDKMGVVYYANYLVWCEVARTEFIRHHGRSYAAWEDSGVMLAVSDVRLRYHRSARYDDIVRIDTALTAVGSRGVTFEYRMHLEEGGARLVSASTSLIAVNPEGRPITLPPEVREPLEALVEPPFAR